MNSYELSRRFVDFSFENPSKIKPNHYALYFFAIEHCNRLGWKKEFGLPTTMTMEAIGIKSYNTYSKTFNELINYGFFSLIEKSTNQYSANVIALSNFNKSLTKALDKAFIKHATKQSESTQQSIDSIDKPINNKQITINHYENDFQFLKDWNDARVSILRVKESNIKKLTFSERQNFAELNKSYEVEDFKNAIRGLLKQKDIYASTQLRPTHLLDDGNLDKYIDAHINNKQLFQDVNKPVKIHKASNF